MEQCIIDYYNKVCFRHIPHRSCLNKQTLLKKYPNLLNRDLDSVYLHKIQEVVPDEILTLLNKLRVTTKNMKNLRLLLCAIPNNLLHLQCSKYLYSREA